MAMNDPTVNVQRAEHEQLRRGFEAHEKLFAVWDERDRNREASLQNFFTETRGQFNKFSESLTGLVKIVEVQAVGLADNNNRITVLATHNTSMVSRIDALEAALKVEHEARIIAEAAQAAVEKQAETNRKNLQTVQVLLGIVTLGLGLVVWILTGHKL